MKTDVSGISSGIFREGKMVGFVLISHSRKLAEGAKEVGLMMAPEVPVEAVGGLPDGSLGTDYEMIQNAILKVTAAAPDGVVVIADMGSSRMTAEMVLEAREETQPKVVLLECPFVEGTVAAMVSAAAGENLESVVQEAVLST